MSVSFTLNLAREISLPPLGGVSFSLALSRIMGVAPTNIQLALNGAPTDLAGLLSIEITTSDGSVYVYFPSVRNIVEAPSGTGRYIATVPRPDVGHYLVVWRYAGQATEPVILWVLPDSIVQTPIKATGFAEYVLKAGDLEPSLLLTLRNAGGDPIDLSGAVGVDIKVRAKGSPEPVVDREIVILDPPDDGQVVLDWLAGETDLPGVYIAEASILWPSNGRSTAPSKASYRFLIEEGSV